MTAKKIVLIQINYSEDHSEKILPLGILSVGSALKKSGYEVELINITENEIDKTVSYLTDHPPLYVGISVMTGIQTQHSAQLSRKIKAKSNLPIVWGGIHPSLMPKQCLEEDYIDYIVISEGEVTIVELTKKIIDGTPLGDTTGLGYKKDGQVVVNQKRSFITNLDDYRLNFSLLDMEKFIFSLGENKRVIAYKASRGCPFNCSFCYNNEFNLNKWRKWSIDAVVADINFLKERYNIDAVKFYDDNFFVDKRHAFEILEKIKLPSHLEIRIDSITDEIAAKMKKYEVFDMLIGVESGSNRILELIDKNFTVDKVIEAVKILQKYDLPASYSVIVGLPTETKEEFEMTIDLLYKIYGIHPRAAFTLGAYLPYPGSKMYQFAIEQGFDPPKDTESWGKIDRFRKSFTSPWVDVKKVWRIREYFKILNWKLGPVRGWLKWRIRHRFFALPIDIYIIEFLSNIALEQKSPIGKLMRRLYNKRKR